jgi:hypothetical protein
LFALFYLPPPPVSSAKAWVTHRDVNSQIPRASPSLEAVPKRAAGLFGLLIARGRRGRQQRSIRLIRRLIQKDSSLFPFCMQSMVVSEIRADMSPTLFSRPGRGRSWLARSDHRIPDGSSMHIWSISIKADIHIPCEPMSTPRTDNYYLPRNPPSLRDLNTNHHVMCLWPYVCCNAD